jgi:HSP20 family molecular chaperone IbpA
MACGLHPMLSYPSTSGMTFRYPARAFNVKFGRPCKRLQQDHRRRQNNLNVSDFGDKVQLSIDLPGVKASDLKVQIEDRVLSISGSRVIQTEQGAR